MTYQAPPPMPEAGGKDNSQLLGIIGIVIGLLCCAPAGIVLGVVSLLQAKKKGGNQLWGILAIGASVLGIIFSTVYFASR